MQKFSQIYEGKSFIPDPSIIKKYAAYIMPLYFTGKLRYDDQFMDEYLELNKKGVKNKSMNIVCDLEIQAVKAVIQENPMSSGGYETLKKEIENKCPRLEKFLRTYITDPKNFSN